MNKNIIKEQMVKVEYLIPANDFLPTLIYSIIGEYYLLVESDIPLSETI